MSIVTRSLTQRQLVQRHHDFLREIEPFVKMKIEVFNHSMPRFILYPDGRMEVEHNLCSTQSEIVAKCDELIAMAATRGEHGILIP